jgi:hypothetical protein
MKNGSKSSTLTQANCFATREEAKLCLDHNTVFRDAALLRDLQKSIFNFGILLIKTSTIDRRSTMGTTKEAA